MRNLDESGIGELEQQLRLGNTKLVRKTLRGLTTSRVPRGQILQLANLSRRAGLLSLGIKLLNPIVRPNQPIVEVASPQEKIEYAVLLSRIGATAEARAILEAVDPRAYPESILYQTFTLTPEWRYAETIPLLEQYLSVSDVNPYLQLVAKVNLIAALGFEGRWTEARPMLESSLSIAEKQGYFLLVANMMELAAQSAIYEGEFSAAEEKLKFSSRITNGAGTSDSLHVEKWHAILRACRRPGRLQRENLLRVRQRALIQGEWESVRDCDYHLATRYFDTELATKLYFGTPYSSFQRRLLAVFPDLTNIRSYDWKLGPLQDSLMPIEVRTGKAIDGRQVVPPGQMPHRLLVTLVRDFYRPFRMATLGAELFPGEYFDPIHTPLRVHKTCKRLRAHFDQNDLQLEVQVGPAGLHLAGIGTLTVLPLGTSASEGSLKLQLLVTQLRGRFANRKFSTQEAAKLWDCSLSTAIRNIREAERLGLCEKTGTGRGTAFLLKAA